MFVTPFGNARAIVKDFPVDTAVYASGDAMGVAVQLVGISAPGRPAILRQIIATDAGKVSPQFSLAFYDRAIAAATDNAAFAPTDAEAKYLVAKTKIVTADWFITSVNANAMITPNLYVRPINGSLWVQLVADAANDFVAAGDLSIQFVFERN